MQTKPDQSEATPVPKKKNPAEHAPIEDMEELVVNEISTRSIMSRSNLPTGDYSINPYVGCVHACKYCYASFMNRFTGHKEPWGMYLDVKTWPKIKNPAKYDGSELIIGSVTDPYNPFEKKYKRTQQLLTELKGTTAKITIITKSDLPLRDLKLIHSFPNIRVAWSINTLDERFRQDMDKAVSIERRLAGMEKFHSSGIRTVCFISPIFPGITKVQDIIERARKHCNFIWLENLNLRGEYKPRILKYIKDKYPELSELYTEIYTKNNNRYWVSLAKELEEFCKKQGLTYVVNNDRLERPFTAAPVVINYFYHSEIKKSAKK